MYVCMYIYIYIDWFVLCIMYVDIMYNVAGAFNVPIPLPVSRKR